MSKIINLLIVQKKKNQIISLLILSILLGSTFYYFKKTEVLPQASVFLLEDVRLPNSGEKVLIFSPHADDETLGAGGYILASVQRGALVKIVLVTDSDKHHLKDKRYEEFRNATVKLSVSDANLVYLNYKDGELSKANQNELSSSLEHEITDFNPSIVVYSSPQDTHLDHADIGKIVENTLEENQNKKISSYQYLIHSDRFPQPKGYFPNSYILPPMEMIGFEKEWQKYMLTTDEEKAKEEALNFYQSQLSVPILRSTMLSFIRRNELYVVTSEPKQ